MHREEEQIRNDVRALRRHLLASCGEKALELVEIAAKAKITSKALEMIDTQLSSYSAGDLQVFLVQWATEQKKANGEKL